MRRWVGNHPKTVKAGFGVVNAATVVSGLLDGGASELALPEELIAEDAILEAGEIAAEGAGESAAGAANSANHIFGEKNLAKHGLEKVLEASGGKAQAYQGSLQKTDHIVR